MKLLVCIDNSDVSRTILPMAQRLARETGAEVRLVHVLDTSRIHEVRRAGPTPDPRGGTAIVGEEVAGPGGGIHDPEALVDHRLLVDRATAIATQEAQWHDLLAAAAHDFPAPVQHVILHGSNAANAIIDYVRQEQIDMVAMATRSRRGLRGLTGSVTAAVVQSGAAPVLVVHPAE